MGLLQMFSKPEEEYYDDYDYEESGRYEEEDRSNVANLYLPADADRELQNILRGGKTMIYYVNAQAPREGNGKKETPFRHINDAAKIANELMNLSLVVLNTSEVQKRNPDDVRRILDFLYGAAYAEGGTVKRVSSDVFLVTPRFIDLIE